MKASSPLNRTFIILGYFLFLTSCQVGESAPQTIASSDQIENWLTAYESTENSKRADVDPQFRPEILLPRLHWWFGRGGKMVQPVSLGDGWSIFYISAIPEWVIQDLDKVLIDEKKMRTSFSILTKSFWHSVRAAQSQVKVGFLSFDNAINVSGVYFHSLKVIGLDIFAEPGTLLHEFRHFEQATRLEKIAAAYGVAETDQVLGARCLAVVSSAFGEVDATSLELAKRVHIGIEKEIPIYARCIGTATCDNISAFAFPQISFFRVNMAYPAAALLRIVNEKSCPTDFRDQIKSLARDQDRLSAALAEALESVSHPAIRTTSAYVFLNSPECERQNSIACAKRKVEFDESKEKFTVRQTRFAEALEFETQDRPRRLLLWTETLPINLKTQLCRYASGFEFIADCRNELSRMQTSQ